MLPVDYDYIPTSITDMTATETPNSTAAAQAFKHLSEALTIKGRAAQLEVAAHIRAVTEKHYASIANYHNDDTVTDADKVAMYKHCIMAVAAPGGREKFPLQGSVATGDKRVEEPTTSIPVTPAPPRKIKPATTPVTIEAIEVREPAPAPDTDPLFEMLAKRLGSHIKATSVNSEAVQTIADKIVGDRLTEWEEGLHDKIKKAVSNGSFPTDRATELFNELSKKLAHRFEFVASDGTLKPLTGIVHPQVTQLATWLKAGVPVWAWSAAGSGKLLRLDEPIPTPSGWKLNGDLVVGDVVFDENGKQCNVTGAFQVEVPDKAYRLTFDDGSTIECGEDHQWVTYTAKDLAALTKRTPSQRMRNADRNAEKRGSKRNNVAVIASNKRRAKSLPTGSVRLTSEIVATLQTSSGRANHAIVVAGALETRPANLPIDPYVLGVWLGDGSSQAGSFTIGEAEQVAELEKCGVIMRKQPSQEYGWCGLGLWTALKALNLIQNKHIPRDYLFASQEQRLALLQGLMDSDGHCNLSGHVEFCNKNKELAMAVQFLALSLGEKATVNVNKSTLYGKDCGLRYRVIWTPKNKVFRIPRKLARIKPIRRKTTQLRYIVHAEAVTPSPMRCIAVDSESHLYLAGPNLLPTHNTHMARQVAELLEVPPYVMSVDPTLTVSKIMGYRNVANGGFIPGFAFLPYKDGGLLAMDEIDTGDPGVIASSNALLSNNHYLFPNNETIARHEKFYCLALANTKGTGAVAGYTARNKLDAATLDRFAVIEIKYDSGMEMALACGESKADRPWQPCAPANQATQKAYVDWVQKVRANVGESVLVSPRASINGCKALRAGVPMQEVVDALVLKLCTADTRTRITGSCGLPQAV